MKDTTSTIPNTRKQITVRFPGEICDVSPDKREVVLSVPVFETEIVSSNYCQYLAEAFGDKQALELVKEIEEHARNTTLLKSLVISS